MKQSASRGHTAFGLACFGLLLANGGLGWLCWTAWEQAFSAETQTVRLEQLTRQIDALRQNPIQVEEGARSRDALARLVEASALQAQLDSTQIVRIDPGESRRIEQTPYLEQRTNVEIRETTLQKIIEFALALEQAGHGLAVTSLSCRVPAGAETPARTEELWNAQLLLTSHIYEGNVPSPPHPPTP